LPWWEVVQQICDSVEPFYPVASQKKHRTQHIIDGVKDALAFTILRRGVQTIHPQKKTVGGEECTRGVVIELTAIVALDGFDGVAKLCGDINEVF
jgi:hypothetical protein